MKKSQTISLGIHRLSSLAILISFLFISTNLKAQVQGCDSACNKVINGNFSAGNTGFTSDLILGCNTSFPVRYCVGSTLYSKYHGWSNSSFDHTSGTALGKYLIIDGSVTSAKDVWKQSVSVCKGVKYKFSFWAKNVYAQSNAAVAIGIFIGTSQIGSSVSVNSQSWQQYTVTWTAPGDASVQLALRQMSPGHSRDFGVDDIFFGFCRKNFPACPCQ